MYVLVLVFMTTYGMTSVVLPGHYYTQSNCEQAAATVHGAYKTYCVPSGMGR